MASNLSQIKYQEWLKTDKPTYFQVKQHVATGRSGTLALSIITGFGSVIAGHYLRGSRNFTGTVFGVLAGTAFVSGIASIWAQIRLASPFENDPEWKWEQFNLAEREIFDADNGVMKVGIQEALKKPYVTTDDIKTWFEADLATRLKTGDAATLVQLHGTALANKEYFTDQASLNFVPLFKKYAETCALLSSSELSTAWDQILAAHGMEEGERKHLFSTPAYRKTLEQNDYSILQRNGKLQDLLINDLDRIRALFHAYAEKLTFKELLEYFYELKKFGLIVPLLQKPLGGRRTAWEGFIWSDAGEALVRSNFNNAVQNANNYSVLRENYLLQGCFANIALLSEESQSKLQVLFLNQCYEEMVKHADDMPILGIPEDHRNTQLENTFTSDCYSAWKKHGLGPLHDQCLTADGRRGAGVQLFTFLRNNMRLVDECEPLIRALQLSPDVDDLKAEIWQNEDLFTFSGDKRASFLKYFKRFGETDPRRYFWLDKAQKESSRHKFQVLWTQHFDYFREGLLIQDNFHHKFLAEIQGKSFTDIVNQYGIGVLSLTSLHDVVIRFAIGRYLLSHSRDLLDGNDFNEMQPLKTYGLFHHDLILTISTAQSSLKKCHEELQQRKRSLEQIRDQAYRVADEQFQPAILTARTLWEQADQHVKQLHESCLTAQNAVKSQKNLPQLEAQLLELQEKHRQANEQKPQVDETTLKQALERKQLEQRLNELQAEIPKAEAKLAESKIKASTDTTAFETLGNLFRESSEEQALSILLRQKQELEKRLKENTVTSDDTLSTLQSKLDALKSAQQAEAALLEKQAQIERNRESLRKRLELLNCTAAGLQSHHAHLQQQHEQAKGNAGPLHLNLLKQEKLLADAKTIADEAFRRGVQAAQAAYSDLYNTQVSVIEKYIERTYLSRWATDSVFY